MKIKLTRNAGGHKTGDTISTTPKVAQHLIDAGYAEEVKGRAKKADDATD